MTNGKYRDSGADICSCRISFENVFMFFQNLFSGFWFGSFLLQIPLLDFKNRLNMSVSF
nr:MAG TPA: hypothetical protein [Caudoviricetes sp.]